MSGPHAGRARLPAWLTRLAIPLWVTDQDQRLVYLNRGAELLLNQRSAEVCGFRCYDVIRGRDRDGAGWCRRGCRLMQRLAAGTRQRPMHLQIGRGSGGGVSRVLVLPIPLHCVDGHECLVHCAVPEDRVARIESYLRAVAARDAGGDAAGDDLTSREREILELLATDQPVAVIADHLHVSAHTVRNHIQHILRKLRAHSIQTAVARHLVARRPNRPAPPSEPTERIHPPLSAARRATAAERAARAGALAHPTRQLLLDALADGPQCVSQLTARVGGAQSGVSRHLSVLRRAGLVQCHTDGSRRHYRLAAHPLLVLRPGVPALDG